MSPHLEAAVWGAVIAGALFAAVVILPWYLAQLGDRKESVKSLADGEKEIVGTSPAARGEFIYRHLTGLAMVDYEKHGAVREAVARVLRRVPKPPR